MLFAVVGGVSFPYSALVYIGLKLLIFGRAKKQRPMRVIPWNQYQLVERESYLNRQLAPSKCFVSRGCASFICFKRASDGVDGSLPPKVGSGDRSSTLSDSSSSVSDCHTPCATNHIVEKIERNVSLKSSIKKPSTTCSKVDVSADPVCDAVEEVQDSAVGCTERRKVQWTDTYGRELVQIREFEPSEDGESDDDFEHGGGHGCQCVIQ